MPVHRLAPEAAFHGSMDVNNTESLWALVLVTVCVLICIYVCMSIYIEIPMLIHNLLSHVVSVSSRNLSVKMLNS